MKNCCGPFFLNVDLNVLCFHNAVVFMEIALERASICFYPSLLLLEEFLMWLHLLWVYKH